LLQKIKDITLSTHFLEFQAPNGDVIIDIKGLLIADKDEAYFNATQIAKSFADTDRKATILLQSYLKSNKTKEYLKILDEMLNNDVTQMGNIILSPKKQNIKLKIIRRGYTKEKAKLNGTWFYKDLALDFFRFLDTRFAIMCDQLLKKIITQSHLLHIEREQTKVLFHPLTDTIKDLWILNQTAEQQIRWAYQIIMYLANLKAIGMGSKEYKKTHNISDEQIKADKKISIRDYMSKNELDKIKKAEEDINGLIKYGKIYEYGTLKNELFNI
jgi:hypothetical protein